jgi:thiol peroxidase
MLSDHRSGAFGQNYGTLIPSLRIESRAIFVVDPQNKLLHVEYVGEVGDHPNYDAALEAAKKAAATSQSASG